MHGKMKMEKSADLQSSGTKEKEEKKGWIRKLISTKSIIIGISVIGVIAVFIWSLTVPEMERPLIRPMQIQVFSTGLSVLAVLVYIARKVLVKEDERPSAFSFSDGFAIFVLLVGVIYYLLTLPLDGGLIPFAITQALMLVLSAHLILKSLR